MTDQFKNLAAHMEKKFLDIFPNGHFSSALTNTIAADGGYLLIDIGLIGPREDCPGQIRMNDPMHHRFMIRADPKGMQARSLMGALYLSPAEDSYNAMDPIKTGWRKTTGDGAKIERAFDRFTDKLAMHIYNHDAGVYGRSRLDDKYFITRL